MIIIFIFLNFVSLLSKLNAVEGFRPSFSILRHEKEVCICLGKTVYGRLSIRKFRSVSEREVVVWLVGPLTDTGKRLPEFWTAAQSARLPLTAQWVQFLVSFFSRPLRVQGLWFRGCEMTGRAFSMVLSWVNWMVALLRQKWEPLKWIQTKGFLKSKCHVVQ